MRLSELQEKDIVNVNDGKKVGRIIDARINNEGRIEYLIIEEKKIFRNLLSQNGEISLTFMQIRKIGTDVILVDL